MSDAKKIYDKKNRKTLTLNFYKEDVKYIEEFKSVIGSSNVKKLIALVDLYNKTKPLG
tara:strand:- start:264 stop:437 length:174 start_codon:yes stop_codon:yes gene_type:complete